MQVLLNFYLATFYTVHSNSIVTLIIFCLLGSTLFTAPSCFCLAFIISNMCILSLALHCFTMKQILHMYSFCENAIFTK